MSTPAVSVILPTYNRERVLARAMRSVLAQTFTDIELIVVDDGSSDSTRSIVQSFADPRVVYLHQQNSGVAHARNAGINASRAPFVAFQDSDDEWLVGKLARQLGVLAQHEDVAMVCGGYIVIANNGGVRFLGADTRMQAGDWGPDNIYNFSFITPTWLARKDALERLGLFDEGLPNLEDWEFAMRLALQSRVLALNEALVVKHGSPDGLNAIKDARVRSLEIISERHAEIWRQNPRISARIQAEMGRCLCGLGRMPEARRRLAAAVRLHPSSTRLWLQWLLSLMGRRVFFGVLRLGRKL